MYDVVRLFHLIFGIWIGGAYLFMVPILETRLKRLGPAFQGPVMQSLMPILTLMLILTMMQILTLMLI